MNILLVDQRNVLAFAVVTLQHLYMILLDQPGLFRNIRIGICQHFLEEAIPLAISKLISVHFGELLPEVGDKIRFLVDL